MNFYLFFVSIFIFWVKATVHDIMDIFWVLICTIHMIIDSLGLAVGRSELKRFDLVEECKQSNRVIIVWISVLLNLINRFFVFVLI